MKLAEKILNVLEAIDYAAIADTLANVEEIDIADLVELGLPESKSKKLINAWFEVDAKERNKLGFSEKNLINWIKNTIK